MPGFLGGEHTVQGGRLRKTEGQMSGLGTWRNGLSTVYKDEEPGKNGGQTQSPGGEAVALCCRLGLEACCQRSLLCFASLPTMQLFFS